MVAICNFYGNVIGQTKPLSSQGYPKPTKKNVFIMGTSVAAGLEVLMFFLFYGDSGGKKKIKGFDVSS